MTLHIGTQTQKLLSNFPKTCHVTSSWAHAGALLLGSARASEGVPALDIERARKSAGGGGCLGAGGGGPSGMRFGAGGGGGADWWRSNSCFLECHMLNEIVFGSVAGR